MNQKQSEIELSKILTVAWEVGKNGHPLNTELLVKQLQSLIDTARKDTNE